MTLVKICGVCDVDAALAAARAGADLIGLHFCSSVRRIEPAAGRSIVDALAGLDPRPQVVGVFIDQPEAEVASVAELVGLDIVQLHGSEPPGFFSRLPIIKALKVREGTVPEVKGWADPILLDSWTADHRGGTGETWDWDAARRLLDSRRVFFAGGLTPGNVGDVVSRYRPHGVDVSSGVENSPRIKDPEKILGFVQAVRDADRG